MAQSERFEGAAALSRTGSRLVNVEESTEIGAAARVGGGSSTINLELRRYVTKRRSQFATMDSFECPPETFRRWNSPHASHAAKPVIDRFPHSAIPIWRVIVASLPGMNDAGGV